MFMSIFYMTDNMGEKKLTAVMFYCMSNNPSGVKKKTQNDPGWSLKESESWPKSLLSFSPGSPLICNNDGCANVMWDLSVALRR